MKGPKRSSKGPQKVVKMYTNGTQYVLNMYERSSVGWFCHFSFSFQHEATIMPSKKVQYTLCSKCMLSYNLKPHLQSGIDDPVSTGQKRARLQYTDEKSGAVESDHLPRNPQIRKLVNKIINDGAVDQRYSKTHLIFYHKRHEESAYVRRNRRGAFPQAISRYIC